MTTRLILMAPLSMQLLQVSRVPITNEDRVFGYSRSLGALLTSLVLGERFGFLLGRQQPSTALWMDPVRVR
jgi:hypothetical protein